MIAPSRSWPPKLVCAAFLSGCVAASDAELAEHACERATGAPIAFVVEGEVLPFSGMVGGCETIESMVSVRSAEGPEREVLLASQSCPPALLASHDGGCTWTSSTPPGVSTPYHLVASTGGRAYSFWDHEVNRIDDGVMKLGTTFAHENGQRLVGLAADGDLVVVMNSAGSVHRSTDAGETWEKLTTVPTASSWSTLVGGPSSAANLIATSEDARKVVYSHDAGKTWRLAEMPWEAFDARQPAIAAGGQIVWMVGSSAIYRSIDGGETFEVSVGEEGGEPILGVGPRQVRVDPERPDVVLFMSASALGSYDASSGELSILQVDLDARDPDPADDHGVEMRSFTVTAREPRRILVGFSLYPY